MAHRRRIELLTLCLVAVTAVATGAQGQGALEEPRLKAAFVSRFPRFTEWPAAALNARDSFEICVMAPGAFATNLKELTAGESLNGRSVVVRDVPPDRAVDSCHLLFISARAGPETAPLLKRIASSPILTVGDAEGFLDQGGIIRLRIVDRRVRFEINARAAERAGLRLSSQLLQLAVAVRGAP